MSESHKIYILTNTENDKVYVGYTSQKYVSERWGKHKQEARKGRDTHLYRAIRLYGEKAFSWRIISVHSTTEEAKNAEKLWIILLRASHSDYGYNTTEGGESPRHTKETKLKISKIQRDNPRPKEFYERLVALSHTPEHCARHSEAIKKAWEDGKYVNRNGENHWTRKFPEIWRQAKIKAAETKKKNKERKLENAA